MKQTTRREFLSQTILGTVGAGMALRTLDSEHLLAFAQPDKRAYQAGKYGIFLDGAMAGWLESAEGGHATSDVVTGKFGLQTKSLAGVKYEDITLSCGTGMSKGFYDWIKASFDGLTVRKTGAIVTCDFNYKEVSRLEFSNALISEIGFPALDAASKDAAKMTIKISPEITRMTAHPPGSPEIATAERASQKKWLPSNFRMQIDGLNCSRVNKIEAITVKQKVVDSPVGELRRQPIGAQNPNLVITLPEADSESLAQWHKQSLIGGATAPKRNGQLEYLTPDLREALFALTFRNLSIASIVPDKAAVTNENVRRLKAQMYCEEIKFSYGSVWA